MNLELQTPLIKAVNSVTVLDNVVEVLARGLQLQRLGIS